jgi:hypothetical protein
MFFKNKNTLCINRCAQILSLSKYSYISIHDNHELMMMYDTHVHLDSFNTITNDGLEYIVETFNIDTWKAIHNVFIYRAHSCSIFTFLNNFQTIIQHFS